MPKRIAILHYSVLPVVGGIEDVISSHIELFINAGYEMHIITGRGGDHPTLKKAQLHKIEELDTQYETNKQIYNQLIADKLDQNLLFDLQKKISNKLEPILKSVDLLTVHNVMNFHYNMALTLSLYELVDKLKIPTVAWCHDPCRYINPDSGVPQKTGFPWDSMRKYHPEIKYVTISQKRKKSLVKILSTSPDNIDVISNGVDQKSLFALSDFGVRFIKYSDLDNRDLVFLMPVRITLAKNFEYAMGIMKALKTFRVSLLLIVSGPPDPHSQESNDYFVKLQNLRKEYGLENDVIFMYEKKILDQNLEIKSLAEVSELYRICDVVLMTSLREGFGLPIIQAGLLGKTIFTSHIPIADEINEPAIHFLNLEEPPEVAAKKIFEWSTADENLRMRQKMRKEYLWEQIFVKQIEPIFKKILTQ